MPCALTPAAWRHERRLPFTVADREGERQKARHGGELRRLFLEGSGAGEGQVVGEGPQRQGRAGVDLPEFAQGLVVGRERAVLRVDDGDKW